MTNDLKERMAKYIHRTVTQAVARGTAIDAIDLTERILDAVEMVHDMAFEEAGIASIPDALRTDRNQTDEPAWDFRANAPAPQPEDPRPHFLAPPPTKTAITPIGAAGTTPKPKSLLVMPGDADFHAPTASAAGTGEAIARPGVIKASMKKARTMRPASNSPAKQYWDEPTLIETIDKHTPAEIPFTIERADGTPVKIVAKKNIQNRQGLGGVVLTYRDPRVGDGGNISLTAQHPFSLYDEEIDIEVGLKSIVDQLVGLYRDRSAGTPDPVAVGAPPNLGDYMRNGMPGGSVDITIDRDDSGRAVNISGQAAHADRDKDEILQRVLQSTRNANRSMVPAESRLK